MTAAGALAGKVALVTGSTSGIGLAMVRALAAAGADIGLHGLGDKAAIANIQDSLKADFGVRVAFSDANLMDPPQIKKMVDGMADKLGGIQFVSPVEKFPEDKWDAIIAVCLNSTFHATKAAVPHMLDAGWGRIINTGSMHALVASPFKSAYNAAKHGVAGFTKTVALELAQKNITCNAICPGYVLTDLVKNQLKDTAKARGIPEEEVINNVLLADQPTKQFVKPEDLAAMVVHLCGPNSASITGACISVDGGWTAR